jgi:glycosyltransferase involved in cell wall biosynthesis
MARTTPIRVLTNFQDLNEAHSREARPRFDYFSDDVKPIEFLKRCLGCDVLILNTDPQRLMLACAFKWLMPLTRFRIVSVDLIVRTPRSARARLKTLMQKVLFKRVHRFIFYFRDLRGCQKFYGIGADRAVFVPFKVNAQESITRRLAAGVVPEGEYVMCAGRTMRDVPTFVEAMRQAGCQGILHQQPKDLMAAHGTTTWEGELPPNVKLVVDDSNSHEVFLDYVAKARLIVIPRYKHDIGPAGIATYLIAMAMNKCVIVSDGPGVGDVLTDEAAIVPPEEVDELAKQIELLWNDYARRNAIANRGRKYADAVGGDDRLYRDVLRVSFETLGQRSQPTDVAVRQTLPMTAAIGVRQTSEDV